jgi:hypothetical protein
MDNHCLNNGCFDIFKILSAQGKLSSIKLYPLVEVDNDPYEHTKTESFLNPITIKALIQQITQTHLRWKYFGQVPSGSIQIICEDRFYNAFIGAGKIEYDGNEYGIWKDDSKVFGILKRPGYIVVVLERAT